MLSSDEKYRLIQAHRDEPLFVAAVVFRCIASLLLFAGVALIGVVIDFKRPEYVAQRLAPHQERASIADARERLEERRARFESAQEVRREMTGASVFGADAKAATTAPGADEVSSLRQVSE